uniref:Thiazole synthase n=1 Tax=Dermonema virens TaxID=1077399 RepID=A0A1G4NRG4_9FLOR|nr:thiG protein [Dermonema virens]SCW21248.1 thiG protein [Dermonema virens]
MNLSNSRTVSDLSIYPDNSWIVGDKVFSSRLMLGTGKYKSIEVACKSIQKSQASIVTVAMRRLQNANNLPQDNLLYSLPWDILWLLPNTAGCTTADEAVRVASFGREICKRLGQETNTFVKLEVIPDSRHLFPDPVGTLKAAEYLVSKGYVVLPYIFPDPMLAKQLEELGCATVMPLGSPIGSGQGIKNLENIQAIIDRSAIPVVVDAGIGTASDAVKAMEIGSSAVLVNSAIAHANCPVSMANAMRLGVLSGRYASVAGRMKEYDRAIASSPSTGILP